MAHKLKLKLTKHPDENSLLAACRVRPSRRLLKKVFGTVKPRHKMAILLPGDDADRVEIQVCETPDESLMALAEAVYEYFTLYQGKDQIIIVDNPKTMADISIVQGKANIIRFTKKINEGHYGFLVGLTDTDIVSTPANEETESPHAE